MSDANTNAELQADELTALESIYGDDMSGFDASSGSFSITIRGSANISHEPIVVTLRVTMPPLYPSDSPPLFELSAPCLRGDVRRDLESNLISVCQDNAGCPIVYAWVEAVRQFLEELEPSSESTQTSDSAPIVANDSEQPPSLPIPLAVTGPTAAEFHHGEPIEDRRSVFQAHLLAPVDSVEAARQGLLDLLSVERKLASATHNIWAYRIARPAAAAGGTTATFITDCDDDGENQAGGRLLRLLELADARNALVVVSRWYGGVQLGPDRFRHISNAARRLLEAHGLVHAGGSAGGPKRHKGPCS